jgi:hypothetical protein
LGTPVQHAPARRDQPITNRLMWKALVEFGIIHGTLGARIGSFVGTLGAVSRDFGGALLYILYHLMNPVVGLSRCGNVENRILQPRPHTGEKKGDRAMRPQSPVRVVLCWGWPAVSVSRAPAPPRTSCRRAERTGPTATDALADLARQGGAGPSAAVPAGRLRLTWN